jgi:malonyl-CoA O-methyltransferase
VKAESPAPAPDPTPRAPQGAGWGEAASRGVDAVALQRAAVRLQAAPAAPWLHTEVARRMAERLAVVRMQPQTVLDWGAQVGGGRSALAAAYPHARVLAVDAPAGAGGSAPASPAAALPWWSPRRWRLLGGAGAARAPALAPDAVEPGSAQLVWAGMVLHGLPEPRAAMRQWHRALAVDGFLMFATLGPGTLAELRALYDEAGWGPPMAPLVDMHDFGDMLVECGFADPVMDQETVVLTWADARAALAELRTLGANVHPQRMPGLRTPRWRAALEHALQRRAGADGRVRLSFEIAYGHAFRPLPRPRVAAEARVDLADLRALARSSRAGPHAAQVPGPGRPAQEPPRRR